MTAFDGTTTLADVVNARPESPRLLEAFGLDYCCGGHETLAVACANRGLALDEVLAALAGSGSEVHPADWATLDPAELVDHLEATHHAYLHVELDRLANLVDKVAGVHGQRHPELTDVRARYRALREDLEPHLMKEERVLFPMVRELAASAVAPTFHCGSLQNPIGVMQFEHDRAGELLRALRGAAGDYAVPADGCASYQALYDGLRALEADTHLHIHKENNLLFPAVVALEAERRTP